jgi:ribonuclease J
MLLEDVDTGDALVIDAGSGFPREGPASELLIANPDFLIPYRGRLKAYVCTHGHEDHIGAVGYFHRVCPAPIHAAPTTLALIRHRCADMELPMPDLQPWLPGEELSLGAFQLTALAVSHSIPDSLCVLVEAGGVRVLHSGDFRVDRDPVAGPATDMSGLSALEALGVDLLMADSTGAVTPGHNPGERAVIPGLTALFEAAPRRIFLTTFASHIQRLQVVAQLSARLGRRILLAGRGAITHSRIAQDLGNLKGLDGITVHPSEASSIPAHQLTVILSGCQGEDHSAFHRLAHGDARLPPVQGFDTVIHSARAVPGNEGRVASLLDACAQRGAHVVDGREGVHVSGHGQQEDMRALINAVKPRAVLPLHGGFRHLHALAQLAQQEGVDPDMTPVVGSGTVLEIAPHAPPRVVEHRPVEGLLVDNDGQLFRAGTVLHERVELSAGLIVVSATLDGTTGEVRGAPRLTQRGIGGGLAELVTLEGSHEAHVSINALSLEERMDAETVQQAMARGVRRVLRRGHGPLPTVVAHAHLL